ncbi:hypothetical protein AYL99_10758 [Fonsecaea erecta]|uniref:Geranylgeranyl transferase type-2 subunit beta n=1 Tax=Fonsecaea erecta TaxID=1367422 RepID=A0A178Z5L1_9EURO|nr:hypothetical protein AYL99_10758 [Fonsecaea erecta]OAP55058.1 hypothetical protein AYL99_10758 [Fonsecaea erecta]
MSLVAGPGVGGAHSVLPTDLCLVVEKHVKYIQLLDTRKDELDYWLTEHLRLNGVYWGLTALHLLGHPDALPRDETLQFVFACQNPDGGFGAAPGHDSHMLYTVSAVQILATINALDELEEPERGGKERTAKYIANLQNSDTGTFAGDEWGETDTRFLYCAFNALSILDMMHLVDVDKAVAHIGACANFDGGFGRSPGAESHSGQIFTCLGALTIARRLDIVDQDRLAAWLSERQLPNGGLNGRPEKLEDVCYSWWVLSSIAMLGKLHWIDATELTQFILRCQDVDHGGFADRPGDMVDVFHTVFGLAGLSLLGCPGLVEVDPVYSKGHLSEFHKLQVRSYQDIAAGVELATYSHWYQQHDIDRLLSERMQMKENKQAKKRRVSVAARNACGPQPGFFDNAQLNPPLPPRRQGRPKNQAQTQTQTQNQPQRRSTRGKQARRAVDDTDSDFSPVKPSRQVPAQQIRKASRPQAYSPVKRSLSPDDPFRDDCPLEDDRPGRILATPEHMKLKGTVWPGMDLFDAATQEMQQKRNQKKDASVLRRMEKLAALVEPTEVVYSPRGTNILKARHIDDLEDESSLVEGETPIPKAKQPLRPRKRRPLAEKDANAPRLVKRKVKTGVPKRYADLPFAQGLPPLPYLPSSSTGESYGLGSRYLPTEDDEEDVKPPVQAFASRKRPPPFEVFADGSPTYHGSMSRNGNRNPLQPGPRGYANAAFQQLPKVSTSWLQPQYQSALQLTDPYTSYRPVVQEYQAFYETQFEHENMLPLAASSVGFRGGANPLAWKSPIRPPTDSGLPPSDSPLGNFFSLFPGGSPGEDPFVTTKNPLAAALPHLESEQQHVLAKEKSMPLASAGASNGTEV